MLVREQAGEAAQRLGTWFPEQPSEGSQTISWCRAVGVFDLGWRCGSGAHPDRG